MATDRSPVSSGAQGDRPLAIALRRLQLFTALLAAGLVILAVVVFARPVPVPSVLSVERLDVLEPDGSLAFVIAGSGHPQAALLDGQVILAGQDEERGHPALLFFDGRGDEVGGIGFSTLEGEAGVTVSRHLSLDGFKQDETLVLVHRQSPEGAESGLVVFDRPLEVGLLDALRELGLSPGATRAELEAVVAGVPPEQLGPTMGRLFGVQRMFLGSDTDNRAGLVLLDGRNRVRLELLAPEDGNPSLSFFDADGQVVLTLPESE